MTLISQDHKTRTYYTNDWDEAKAFERMFDGDFVYSENGYTITI